MKWWLFVLAFVLGALVTWIYMVRRATREVRIVEVDSPEALGAADDYDDDGAYEAGYDEEYDDDDLAYGDSPAADVAVTERRAALVDEPTTVRHALPDEETEVPEPGVPEADVEVTRRRDDLAGAAAATAGVAGAGLAGAAAYDMGAGAEEEVDLVEHRLGPRVVGEPSTFRQ